MSPALVLLLNIPTYPAAVEPKSLSPLNASVASLNGCWRCCSESMSCGPENSWHRHLRHARYAAAYGSSGALWMSSVTPHIKVFHRAVSSGSPVGYVRSDETM